MYTGNTHSAKIRFDRVTGLSLCIQGTRFFYLPCFFSRRFIPVYTGNTLMSIRNKRYSPVYPCVYREHRNNETCCIICRGLSLCIQGTHDIDLIGDVHERFIPVYTGNTPIITYCFIIKILTVKFLPIF